MLIRINHGRWLNFDLDELNGITIAHATFNGKNDVKFTVNLEFTDYTETSDFFDTFDEAEAFALEIVDKINSEAIT